MTACNAESAFLEHFAALETGLPGHGLPWLEAEQAQEPA